MTDTAALFAALFAPATQVVECKGPPAVRKRTCRKCPFGNGLTASEQSQADAIKARLEHQPDTVWGCHETVRGERPQICAGFAKWKAGR